MSEEKKPTELLENFILNNENLEKLEDKIATFNLFEAIGIKRQEIRHSATLAFLLSPENSHGFGQYFLKRILKDITCNGDVNISPIDIDCADFSDAEIRREWKNIDILIICEKAKIIIAIENKIDASESEKQLAKYKNTIDNEKSWGKYEKLYVFLTVDGDEPQNADGWTVYTHEKLIKELEKSLNAHSTNIGQDQEILIRHYIELMRRHVLSDSEEAELARKIYVQHKDAIDLIIEQIPDWQREISDHVFGYIKKYIKEHGNSKIQLAGSGKSLVRFYCNSWDFGESWHLEDRAWLNHGVLFELFIPRDTKKLRLDLVVAKLPNSENKKILTDALLKALGSTQRGKAWPKVWKYKDLTLPDVHNTEKEVIFEKIDKWLKDFIQNDFEEICSKVNEVLDEIGARP